jgi:hypothetical protein
MGHAPRKIARIASTKFNECDAGRVGVRGPAGRRKKTRPVQIGRVFFYAARLAPREPPYAACSTPASNASRHGSDNDNSSQLG